MSALSSAAVLPLVTTSSIANEVAGPACSRPDLARRFEDFYALWLQKRANDELENRAYEAAVLAGQPFEFSDADLDEWSTLNAERDELIKQIMAVPPASLADIVLQARACAIENNLDWIDGDSVRSLSGSGRGTYRRLVESIAGLAGAELFPGVSTLPTSLASD
jgi:hypothetical protein